MTSKERAKIRVRIRARISVRIRARISVRIRSRISVRRRAGPVNAVSDGSNGLQSRCTLSVHTIHWHCHRHVSLKHRHPTHRGTSTCDEEIKIMKCCSVLWGAFSV
jgi:hypothetical protein